ncbi:MAG: DUF4398 domain-containing protein [Chloroflexia bacterium]
MNSPLPSFRSIQTSCSSLLLIFACVAGVFAQSDMRRQAVVVTYPLDQSVTIRFQGTTRLPRLNGEAKVKRSGRRGTRVELEIKNLPRALELGSVYTTYVLWAISPEGRADNLGEIKRGGSFLVNSKIDVTTPLQTFALLVTAEPHFLVRGPSRMVVLENLPPRNPGGAEAAMVNVQYIGNTSDYFNDSRVPEVAEMEYIKTPTSLLGARQAINLARYAGAERDAPSELREAQAQIELAENAWRLKQADEDVDALARRATSLGARAEEVSEARAGRASVVKRLRSATPRCAKPRTRLPAPRVRLLSCVLRLIASSVGASFQNATPRMLISNSVICALRSHVCATNCRQFAATRKKLKLNWRASKASVA